METLPLISRKSFSTFQSKDYEAAIKIIDKGLQFYGNDVKLLNNKGIILIHMKNFNAAVKNARLMTDLYPNYGRSWCRLGEAYMSLKKFKESADAYKKLVERNPECKYAECLYNEAMITHLMHITKCFRIQAIKALELTQNDLELAENFLCSDVLKYLEDEEIYQSEPEEEMKVASRPKKNKEYDPHLDPNNVFKSSSIWVGNVTSAVTEDKLLKVFRQYGDITSCVVHHDKYYAFVNFKTHVMATKAMKNFPKDGYSLETAKLIIRFPNEAKLNIKRAQK